MVTASFPWCAPFTGQLAGLFRAYTARKRDRHLLDFDDLLLLWQAALADPVAGPVLRGMFNAVLVDEYQDVNAVQASIVRLLQPDGKQPDLRGRRPPGHLRVRGADPAHLRQLVADYPGWNIVRLDRKRLHYHRRGRDDRHGFGQLTRFLGAEALAACDRAAAAPLAPGLPAIGPLATRVDAALGSLWDG